MEAHSRSKIVARATKRIKLKYYCINFKEYLWIICANSFQTSFAMATNAKRQTFSDQTQINVYASELQNIVTNYYCYQWHRYVVILWQWHGNRQRAILLTNISFNPSFKPSQRCSNLLEKLWAFPCTQQHKCFAGQ